MLTQLYNCEPWTDVITPAGTAEQCVRCGNLSELDSLTGLRTVRSFFDDLAHHYLYSRDASLALLLTDFEHFREVNRKYGNQTGDLVLRAMGSLFSDWCAKGLSAIAYRYGGTSFDVILPSFSSDDAQQFAEGLRLAVANWRYQDITMSLSIGVAVAPRDGATMADLIESAYQALRKAKANGSNRVELS